MKKRFAATSDRMHFWRRLAGGLLAGGLILASGGVFAGPASESLPAPSSSPTAASGAALTSAPPAPQTPAPPTPDVSASINHAASTSINPTPPAGIASGGPGLSRVPLAEGATAPTVALRDLEGQVATFPTAGQWNLVFFWSLFCHTCLEEVPLLASESIRYANLPCSAVFVSLDTARMKKGLENYLKKRRLTCRILLEETVDNSRYFAADQWGVSQTPTTFLVDPSGKIVFQRQGPFDVEELWAKLREAAGGKTP